MIIGFSTLTRRWWQAHVLDNEFRASLARLSASYADDDAFDKAVKGCWKLEAAQRAVCGAPRELRGRRLRIKVAWPSSQPEEEEEEEIPHVQSEGGTTRTTSTRGWSRASRWVCWTS